MQLKTAVTKHFTVYLPVGLFSYIALNSIIFKSKTPGLLVFQDMIIIVEL